jgi:hypothetical protein
VARRRRADGAEEAEQADDPEQDGPTPRDAGFRRGKAPEGRARGAESPVWPELPVKSISSKLT